MSNLRMQVPVLWRRRRAQHIQRHPKEGEERHEEEEEDAQVCEASHDHGRDHRQLLVNSQEEEQLEEHDQDENDEQPLAGHALRTDCNLQVDVEVSAENVEEVNIVPEIFEVKSASFPELRAVINGREDETNADGDEESLARYLRDFSTHVRSPNIQA